jgi:VWFA-related protein
MPIARQNRAGHVFLTILLLTVGADEVRTQIRTQVDLVVVPVTVKDSKGKLVTGLTKEDFTIREDTTLQSITNFSIDPQPLSAAIVVDDGMNGNQLRRLFPRFSPSVFTTLGAGFTSNDRIVPFRYDSHVYRLSDFTSDPVSIEKSFKPVQDIAVTRPDETADMLGEKGPRALRSIINILGSTMPSERPAYGALNDALYETVTALQEGQADRRKIVILISDGKIAGDNMHGFQETVNALLKEQIQVYGVAARYATFGSFGTLTSYAAATGGDVYPGTSTDSIEKSFLRITEQARNQYVLGYVSTNHAERPTFRNIKVTTRSRNDTVIHRTGYTQQPQ